MGPEGLLSGKGSTRDGLEVVLHLAAGEGAAPGDELPRHQQAAPHGACLPQHVVAQPALHLLQPGVVDARVLLRATPAPASGQSDAT